MNTIRSWTMYGKDYHLAEVPYGDQTIVNAYGENLDLLFDNNGGVVDYRLKTKVATIEGTAPDFTIRFHWVFPEKPNTILRMSSQKVRRLVSRRYKSLVEFQVAFAEFYMRTLFGYAPFLISGVSYSVFDSNLVDCEYEVRKTHDLEDEEVFVVKNDLSFNNRRGRLGEIEMIQGDIWTFIAMPPALDSTASKLELFSEKGDSLVCFIGKTAKYIADMYFQHIVARVKQAVRLQE